MKILELTNYSAGICGVWQRVKQESKELTKRGHKVVIFSSSATKGSKDIAPARERIDNLEIVRFPFKKLGGESFMKWNFEDEAVQQSPDVIIAHNYRHLHTTKAINVAKRLRKQGKKCKVFLVTHAPFIKDNSTRSFFSKLIVKGYDWFYGPKILKKFDKIIYITLWEVKYLERLGVKKTKRVYIPNGIPEDFFKSKPKKGKGILFLGRISPIKDLESLILAVKDLPQKVAIVGPAEKDYQLKLTELIKSENISNVTFYPPIYSLAEKIKLLDKYESFVLPSKREAMPQALLEAMSRGRICISSDTLGGKEVLDHNKSGFIFERGNKIKLTELIDKIRKIPREEKIRIGQNARNKARTFRWDSLIKKLENLF